MLFRHWSSAICLLTFLPTFITAQEKKNPPEDADVPVRLFPGSIISINAENSTLVASIHSGKERRPVTFNVPTKVIPVTSDPAEQLKVEDLPKDAFVLFRVAKGQDIVGIYYPPPTRVLRIQKVDPEKRTITFADAPGFDPTLPVTKEPRLLVNGRFLELKDIPDGVPARVTLRWDFKAVLGLQIPHGNASPWRGPEGPAIDGIIEKLDRTKGTLTVLVEQDGKKETKVFESVPNFSVSLVDGKSNNIGDLLPGMPVTLHLSRDKEKVIRVVAVPSISGELKAVDVKKRTLTLAGIKEGEDRVIEVDPTARFAVYGWRCELRDFQIGWKLSVVTATPKGKATAVWTLDGP